MEKKRIFFLAWEFLGSTFCLPGVQPTPHAVEAWSPNHWMPGTSQYAYHGNDFHLTTINIMFQLIGTKMLSSILQRGEIQNLSCHVVHFCFAFPIILLPAFIWIESAPTISVFPSMLYWKFYTYCLFFLYLL